MALQAYKSTISTSGSALTLSDEPMSAQNVANTEFIVGENAKRLLDSATPIDIKVGGTSTNIAYNVDYLFGIVRFQSSPTGNVTVSGKYLPLNLLAQVRRYELKMECAELDDTEINAGSDRGYYTYQPGLINVECDLEIYAGTEFGARRYVLEINSSACTYRGWFEVLNVQGKGAVADLEMQDITLKLAGDDLANFSYIANI